MPFEVLLGAWVAAGLTLFIFTFLYKDNPLFKLAEHLYVGISVGYTVVKGYELLFRLIIDPVFEEGEWWRLIPVAIGTLMLARYVPSRSRRPARFVQTPASRCEWEIMRCRRRVVLKV